MISSRSERKKSQGKAPQYFEAWENVPRNLKTRRQWTKERRAILPDEEPVAEMVISTFDLPLEEAEYMKRLILRIEDDNAVIVENSVPLFHEDQTRLSKITDRTLAYLDFEDIFTAHAQKDCYARWNAEENRWTTVNASQENFLAPFLSPDLIRRCINQREIIGIRGTDKTRFIAIDLDFHGQDRKVFLDQAEVLLKAFHGKHGWHYQVSRDDVNGIHFLKVLDKASPLALERTRLRNQLKAINASNPNLANRATSAGMKTLADLEIYPDQNRAFRLPLCRGRQMILDRFLEPISHRKREVQDVESYVAWIKDPLKEYLPAQEILDFLWMNTETDKRKAQKVETPAIKIYRPDPFAALDLLQANKVAADLLLEAPDDDSESLFSKRRNKSGYWRELCKKATEGVSEPDCLYKEYLRPFSQCLFFRDLFALPEDLRVKQIAEELFQWVMAKSNGNVSRLNNGRQQDVFAQCQRTARQVTDTPLKIKRFYAEIRSRDARYPHRKELLLDYLHSDSTSLLNKEEIYCERRDKEVGWKSLWEESLPDEVNSRVFDVINRHKHRKRNGRYPFLLFSQRFMNSLWQFGGEGTLHWSQINEIMGRDSKVKDRKEPLRYKKLLAGYGFIEKDWENTAKAGKKSSTYSMTDVTYQAFEERSSKSA